MLDIYRRSWTIGNQISEFIYEAKRPQSKQFNFVIKKKPCNDGGLFNEIHFYSGNCSESHVEQYKESKGLSYLGIPILVSHGLIDQDYRFLVINRYSIIERDLKVNDYIQLLDVLEYMHSRGYSHGDLKPTNIICNSNDTIVLLDFETASRFKRDSVHARYQYRQSRVNIGTQRYLSIDSHEGILVSARGDIESLGYLISDKELPWTSNDEDVYEQKRSYYGSKVSCYARALKYDEPVNYSYVKMLILDQPRRVPSPDICSIH